MGLKLVAHWGLWWRRASSWLAMLNGLFVTYIFSQPILVIGLLGFAPGEWLIPLAIFLGFAAFGLPILVTNISQPKLKEKCEEARVDAAVAAAKTEVSAGAMV